MAGAAPTDINQGIDLQGAGYWAGVVEFERLSRGKHPQRGSKGIAALEALIAELTETGKSFRVPMPSQSDPVVVFEAESTPGTFATPAQAGSLATVVGGKLGKPSYAGSAS